MANRTLYFEIDITKWEKEFLSSFHTYTHFNGGITLVLNGRNCNNYMYTAKGIVNCFVGGAMRYYNDYGFDYSKEKYFSVYQHENNHQIHSFALIIDEKAWSVALKYGAVIENKKTSAVQVPSGKDVYKIVCKYENGFEPKLVLVESYASKLKKQEQEELRQHAEKMKQEHSRKLALSTQYFNLAVVHSGNFINKLEAYFTNVDDKRDDYTYYKNLCSELEAEIKNVEMMPYKTQWTKDYEELLNLQKKQLQSFEDYIFSKLDLSHRCTIFSNQYGEVNHDLLNKANRMTKEKADAFTDLYINSFKNKDWLTFSRIPLNDILYIMWFYALTKPFDSNHFEEISKIYCHAYQRYSIESFIAKCYAMMQVATEDVISDQIRSHLQYLTVSKALKNQRSSFDELHQLSSALMWMKAYKSEEQVLQFMLKNNVLMSAKEQERLHLLSTSANINLNFTNHSSSSDLKAVRMDSLDWKSEEYTSFFNNLAFQNKNLTDILALRDDHKDLVLSSNFALPPLNVISEKIQATFYDEYGDAAKVSLEKINSITLDDSEEMEGLLAVSNEVSSLGIFTLLIRIGKKLNIKFYTLYLPEDVSVEQQTKKVISMHKKINPTVTMWEKSLKDTFLTAIEQVLNSSSISSKRIDSSEIESF